MEQKDKNIMKTDTKGCSTCKKGVEQFEEFIVLNKTWIQYDYRHTTGELFSTTTPTLETARNRRDEWLITLKK